MGIRSCALQSSAFGRLKEVYDHREQEILRWRGQGRKVVAELGPDVPDELVMAAGMLPVRIYAEPGHDLPEADKYLEYAFDPMIRAQFQKIVDGSYSGLADAIAISNSTDVIIRVYLYLRELKRVEPERPIPPVAFLDWLFTRNRLHQERNELVIRLFREEVEAWAGHAVSDEAIREAAHVCNEDKQLLRRLDALRSGDEVRISGSEMLVIIGSAFFMDRSEHVQLLKALCEEAPAWPVIEGPRIFYTGSVQTDTALYEKIEESGCVIVGEDHDWGSRFFDRDYPMEYDPVRALVDCYMLRTFSSKKAFVSQRVAALESTVKAANASGVLFYTNIYEDAASWDYPSQKKCLEDQGIRTLHFSKMPWPPEGEEYEEFCGAIRRFAQTAGEPLGSADTASDAGLNEGGAQDAE